MTAEMGIFETIHNARAMRRLKPDPVPEELLVRLIDAANQAPSGSNAQVSRWLVVRDPEQKAKLAALNKAAVVAYVGPGGTRAPAMPHQDPEKRERQRQAVLWQADHLHEAPALIFACLELGQGRADTFAAGLGAGGSIWPGVQNLLLAARALGLGATPTTLGLRDRAAVREILALPASIEPVCLIPVGYPMGKFGPVTRRPVAEVMRWDRWSD
jgi:nitroreductase